jgi:AcrR family transcriptional regulator
MIKARFDDNVFGLTLRFPKAVRAYGISPRPASASTLMDEPRDPEPERLPLLRAPRRLGDLRIRPVVAEELRTELGLTAIEVAGEAGYDAVTVERILARGGPSRSAFYRVFDSAGDCYRLGYEETAGRLVDGLLARCREAGGWQRGVRSALDALAAELVAEPIIATGLIIGARSADPTTRAAHERVSERLATAIEQGREVAPAGLTPPPAAGVFVLGAIEVAAVQALAGKDPGQFARRLPDLAFLAVATYLGVDVARGPDA